MYGYTEAAYERVTGVKGSYKMFMDALDLLRKNDIKFELKYVAMEQNYDDVYEMREFGRELGVPMVVILDVHPMSDGSTTPMAFRLSPQEAFDFDIKDEGRRKFWQDVAKDLVTGEIQTRPRKTIERFENGYLYPCSIAHQHVFITSDYKMQGCVRASYRQYDLRKGSFNEGWDYLQRELLDKKSTPNYKCNSCKRRFTDKTNTLMHGSKLPVSVWMQAIYEMSVDNFISSVVMSKKLGINQKSAWLLMTKLRFAMPQDKVILEGIIAQDEMYVGGCLSNFHYSRKLDLLRKNHFIKLMNT